jgi:hypothetical protein
MTKDSIAVINGHEYKYRYNPESKQMDYLGPVGDAPTITQEQFRKTVKGQKFTCVTHTAQTGCGKEHRSRETAGKCIHLHKKEGEWVVVEVLDEPESLRLGEGKQSDTIIDLEDDSITVSTVEKAGALEGQNALVMELQNRLNELTGQDIDGVIFKGREGQYVTLPPPDEMDERKWKVEFIRGYLRATGSGWGKRAKREEKFLKRIILEGEDIPDWKDRVEAQLIGPAAVREGSKMWKLLEELVKHDEPIAGTELKEFMPGGKRGSLTVGNWIDDGYIVKSKVGRRNYFVIGDLGRKVLAR